jgi:hypothetical protein
MTLIVSMRGKFGAIILADSQETVKDRNGDEFKYGVLKSVPEELKGFHFVIAGGGDGDAIDELTEQFKRSLKKSNCNTLECFRKLFERHLKRELSYLKSQSRDERLELIVAASKRGKWQVWRNAYGTLVATPEDVPTLVGFDAEIYKHLGRVLYPHAKTTAQIILVGLRILDLARQSSTCVDAPYNGVMVVPNSLWPIENMVLAELTESVTMFSAQLDRLLLACSDTSLGKKEFTSLLDDFKENALHMRAEYLQTVNEKAWSQEFRSICPVRLFPENSVLTATIENGKVAFDVAEAELTPSTPQKSEPEQ